MQGRPHRLGKVVTSGYERTLSRRNVLSTEAARGNFIKATKGARQTTWDLLRTKARGPNADRTAVARASTREGMDVMLRRRREKPQRTTEDEQERVNLCITVLRWPLKRFLEDTDLIIDNKRFGVPTTPAAWVHLKKQKMVAQLRTPVQKVCRLFSRSPKG